VPHLCQAHRQRPRPAVRATALKTTAKARSQAARPRYLTGRSEMVAENAGRSCRHGGLAYRQAMGTEWWNGIAGKPSPGRTMRAHPSVRKCPPARRSIFDFRSAPVIP
jgi:hypothetical protein